MCIWVIWLKALSSDIWSTYKVCTWSLTFILEDMTTVESLTILILLEVHRDKMRDTGREQQQGK